MRVAIYARVSTERQQHQQTINSQLEPLHTWVASNGHTLDEAHVFRDEGYSGARLDRPGLDALRDIVRDGAVELVAVLSPDRLARRYAYQVVLLEEFRRAGCDVLDGTVADRVTQGIKAGSVEARAAVSLVAEDVRLVQVVDPAVRPGPQGRELAVDGLLALLPFGGHAGVDGDVHGGSPLMLAPAGHGGALAAAVPSSRRR